MPPAAEQLDRFRRDVETLTGPSPGRLGIAVSGGPDSLALLLLAAAAFPGRVSAATVDHGLRAESAAEAELVAGHCARLEVPHRTLQAKVDTGRASLQRSAREARYRCLADWLEADAVPFLATGHHLEDQAETLVMRLLRGSGASGLSAVRAAGPIAGATVIRPLLGWHRAELRAVVDAAGIPPVEDPSNVDDRFERTRIRRLLGETQWLDPVPLARSAAALAQADDALAWAAERLWGERISNAGDKIELDPADLPAEMIRRLILGILESFSPAALPRGEEVRRLAATLTAGGVSTLAGVLCRGGTRWSFELAPPRKP
jgi:tRNA(Ile)-lysidine synthase